MKVQIKAQAEQSPLLPLLLVNWKEGRAAQAAALSQPVKLPLQEFDFFLNFIVEKWTAIFWCSFVFTHLVRQDLQLFHTKA